MISHCFRFFLFLPLLLLVTVPALARQTPEAVLKEIQAAIDASDLAAFERRVDVDALLDQSSSALIAALQKAGQVDTSGLPPMLALMVASVQDPSMAKQIKGLLVQETGTFTRSGIESGFFAGNPKPTQNPKACSHRFSATSPRGVKSYVHAAHPAKSTATSSFPQPSMISATGVTTRLIWA